MEILNAVTAEQTECTCCAWVAIAVAFCLIAFFVLCACSEGGSSSDSKQTDGKTNTGNVYMPTEISGIAIPAGKSSAARRLMSYLANVQESGATLSGQQDLTWDDSYDQMAKVCADTGKFPAIAGFDFMNYTVAAGWSGQSQTEEAITWHKSGGIVAFCWHWRDPSRETQEYAPSKMTFRIPYSAESKSGLDEASEAFAHIKADLDTIAAELAKLRDERIPILWRPMHEAYGNPDEWGGAWFWWGAGVGTSDGAGSNRAQAYLALYKFMHDYFTNEKGLDNLIWVWNAQNADWYPGDDWADIVAYDNYDLGKLGEQYEMLKSASGGNKIIALGENGTIPALADLKGWAYFNTWNDHSSDPSQCFWSSESHNALAHRKEIYTSASVITRDELPDLTTYAINE